MGDLKMRMTALSSEGRNDRSARPPPKRRLARSDCLAQLILAFRDIAEYDDIHQAAVRLALAQQWICEETERAAADPIFAELYAV